MLFFNGKSKSLSYGILSKVYFGNFITAVVIFCIIAFGISLKFDDVKDQAHANNRYVKNIITGHIRAIDNELKLLQKYISNSSDIQNILEYSLNNSQEYHALYVLNSSGEIEISTQNPSKIKNEHVKFFLSRPWEGRFEHGVFRSKFSFDYGEIPTRFVARQMSEGKILVAEIKFNYIYNELIRIYNENGANSFVIENDGKILFHQDVELIINRKSIFDLYAVKDDYLSDGALKIGGFGFKNLDAYTVSCIENSSLCVVSYRSVENILRSNKLFLAICAAFLLISLQLIFINVRFARYGVIKPVLTMKRLIKKLQNDEDIAGYVSSERTSEFGQMIDGIVKIYENFADKKRRFLEYERKFGYLFEKGPFIILLIDAKTGDIIDASSEALKFYRLSLDEITSKNLQNLNAASIKDIQILSQENSDTLSYQVSQKIGNGEIKDVIIRQKNIQNGADKFGFCVITDVTEDNAVKRNFDKQDEISLYSPIFTLSLSAENMQNITSVSPSAQHFLGYQISDMLDNKFGLKDIIHDDDLDKILSELAVKFKLFSTNPHKKEYEFLRSCRVIKKNLEILNCAIFIKFISKDSKNIDEIAAYFVESGLLAVVGKSQVVPKSESANQNLNADNAVALKYKKLIENLFSYSKEGIALIGTDGKFIDVNDAFSQITGYTKHEVVNQPSSMLKSGVHDHKFYSELWKKAVEEGYWYGNIWNKRKNGEKYLELLTISAIYASNGSIEYFMAIFSDISSAKAKEERLEQIAYYDALTNLPNRFLFAKKLDEAMRQASRLNSSMAAVFIDIDDFKPINDLYGHGVGDKFLIQITRNISGVIKEDDVLARVGGDEFVAIINNLTSKNQINEIIEDILRAASREVVINNRKIKATVSVGASLYPQAEIVSQDELVEQADWAMYQSKLSGKNKYYIFDLNLDRNFKDNYAVADRVAMGLASGQFSLAYQPIINVKSGKVVSLEAFIKWNKDNNAILCEEILPLIAKDNIYDDVVIWNIKTALKDQKLLSQKYDMDVKISINLTLELLYKQSFIEKFNALANSKEYDNLNMLEFDINELNLLKDIDEASEILDIYARHGIALTLDEFGSSAPSLQIAKEACISKLKVSKYLSLGVISGADNLIVLRSILSLYSAFSKQIIAKGVETSENMYFLIKAGYENLQGGFIAPAMRIDSIKAWADAYKIPSKFSQVKALDEDELLWCNLAVMHRGWIKHLLDMLGSSNLAKFDTKEYAKEYVNVMIGAYQKHIADKQKSAIHIQISDIIMQILDGVENRRDISNLVLNLKANRDNLLNLE